MPRIRTVKPEFWQDEDLAELSAETRLLAIGLLNHADDEGYFKANPNLVRAGVFPFTEDSLNVHGMLTELSKIGYLELFEGTDGKQYGHVLNFTKHQKVSHPKESKIKELYLSRNVHGTFTDDSWEERKGKEQGTGKGKEHEKSSDEASVPRELLTEWFETLWSTFDTEFGKKGAKDKAKEKFLKINPDKQLFEKMHTALEAQKAEKSDLKDRGGFWESFPHVVRWLNDRRWTDELGTPASRTVGNQHRSLSDENDEILREILQH